MTVSVKCTCGATLVVSAEMASKAGTCPKCGKTMRIPKEVATAGETGRYPDEAAPADEMPPHTTDLRWPSARLVPLLLAGLGVMVLIAVVVAAIALGPSLARDPGEPKQITAEDYVNPKYGYRLVVPAAWQIADRDPDNLVLQGRADSAETTVAVRRGPENMNEFVEGLIAEAEKEPGFGDRNWNRKDRYNRSTCELTYSYGKDDERRRAVVRTFRHDEAWLVLTFRASSADYQRALQEYEDVFRSIKTP